MDSSWPSLFSSKPHPTAPQGDPPAQLSFWRRRARSPAALGSRVRREDPGGDPVCSAPIQHVFVWVVGVRRADGRARAGDWRPLLCAAKFLAHCVLGRTSAHNFGIRQNPSIFLLACPLPGAQSCWVTAYYPPVPLQCPPPKQKLFISLSLELDCCVINIYTVLTDHLRTSELAKFPFPE